MNFSFKKIDIDKAYFLSFYLLCISILFLRVVEMFDLLSTNVLSWESLYVSVNIAMIILLAFIVFMMITHRLKLGRIALTALAYIWCFYLFMTIVEYLNYPSWETLLMLVFGFWCLITFFYRIHQLNKLINDKGVY